MIYAVALATLVAGGYFAGRAEAEKRASFTKLAGGLLIVGLICAGIAAPGV
ncbi:hypothetical protein [Frigidibacter oleivorans]|uniref:hypothetical protein n=1 Tax=Frigidibacter oleivorans TaxID=2487129 RepID=UPI0013DF7F07|nr:hypothetical protein [Frigidibacter oleivorans]